MQLHGLGMRTYMSDAWNWFAWFSNVTYLIGIILQNVNSVNCYEAARIFRAINFMSFAYQLVRYMTVLETWGILIPVLNRMVSILYSIFVAYQTSCRRMVCGDVSFAVFCRSVGHA